jgi:hypothetical protein
MVQVLLNENIDRLVPFAPLQVTGRMEPQTLAMIAEFQRRVLHNAKPDGRVDPAGATWASFARASART